MKNQPLCLYASVKLLAEKNPWMAEMERLRDPARFWRKLKTFPEGKGSVAAMLPTCCFQRFI
jgi:hypothetical protein